MDTNTNYQNYSGNLSDYLGKNFNYGQLTGLDSSLGVSQGNQPTFQQNGNIYQVKDNGNNTFGLSQIDTIGNRKAEAAQQLYQAQQGSAISGLQSQKTNLSQQYGDLLKTVTGEYQPLINQATTQENNYLGARGLLSQSGAGGNQMSQSLQGIYGQEAANAQQIGQGSINDINALTQAIAQAQMSGASTGANLGLSYGNLALQQQALPSQIQSALAQAAAYNAQAQSAPYVPTGVPGITFNAANNVSSLLGTPLNISSAQLQKVLSSLV